MGSIYTIIYTRKENPVLLLFLKALQPPLHFLICFRGHEEDK